MSKVGFTEISPGEPLKYEHRVKVNDFIFSLKHYKEIRTNMIKIFPGFEAEFVIWKWDMMDNMKKQNPGHGIQVFNVNGQMLPGGDPSEYVFFLVEIEAGEDVKDAKLAGNVRVDIAGDVENVKIGDVKKNVYKDFSNYRLDIKSKCYVQYHRQNTGQEKMNVFVIDSNGWKEECTLELVFTLHHPGKLIRTQEVEVPKTLQTKDMVTKEIMEDEETTDLTLRCHNETFRVHRNFLCNRSPVLRRMILKDMEGKAKKGEILIDEEEIDPLHLHRGVREAFLIKREIGRRDILNYILNDKKFREKLQKAENKNILFDIDIFEED